MSLDEEQIWKWRVFSFPPATITLVVVCHHPYRLIDSFRTIITNQPHQHYQSTIINIIIVMALRAFHSNPCIGGFGGESSSSVPMPILLDPSGNHSHSRTSHSCSPQDGDAFCQIVKELVDNAVDACSAAGSNTAHPNNNQRVKVEIQPYKNDDDNDNNDDILQVTISDNGCGMVDVQACVGAFQSTKNGNGSTSSTTSSHHHHHTAGRYGIGLTLCLVHGQRLVPRSSACITSATRDATHFTRAFYIVDTHNDSVTCHKQEHIQKTNATESGTCVSLMVPVRGKWKWKWNIIHWCCLPGVDDDDSCVCVCVCVWS